MACALFNSAITRPSEARILPFLQWAEAVVLAPLVEEALFKGYLLWSASRAFGPVAGVVISTILFALVHTPDGLVAVVIAGALGGVFAMLAMRTRSILPGALAHAAFNLIQLVLAQVTV